MITILKRMIYWKTFREEFLLSQFYRNRERERERERERDREEIKREKGIERRSKER